MEFILFEQYIIGSSDWEITAIKYSRLDLEDGFDRVNASWEEKIHGFIWF